MKFLIISFYNIDDVTPRAFRTKELKEIFEERGHTVDCITPNVINKQAASLKKHNKLKSLILNALKFILPGGKDLGWSLSVMPSMVNNDIEYDAVISIGLPFSVHLSTCFLRMKSKLKGKVFFADYGDPYAKALGNKFIFASVIERLVLSKFDWVILPHEAMFKAFEEVVNQKKIVICPQTVKAENYSLKKYIPTEKIRFVYAGLLYPTIREPDEFIEIIKGLDVDFEFTVFTDFNNIQSIEIFKRYKFILGSKLKLKPSINRAECIKELSGFDFIVNFENNNAIQVPSKLIDYSIAGRPVLSIDKNISKEKINSFLNRDYSSFIKYSLDNHKRADVYESILLCIRNV